jgi:3-hydroxyisobutyrate dehydrogenase-like beta-hydroxyacid dehydrogenase
MTKIGILHPGEMGISIAASAINSGHQVYWVSQNRGAKTRSRAEEHGLIETESVFELCETCDIIMCVCPPHSAEEVARLVVEGRFQGTYLDANAISPQRAVRIENMMREQNIHFIDASIIGGPAWKAGETVLYLSGKNANVIVNCFKNGPLELKIIGEEAGKASALKMCYAAYSKGTTALLTAVLATAESLGVRKELYQQWDLDDSDFSKQTNRRVIRAAVKAWRFEGEMKEVESTFQAAGLPGGFHEAAAEVYHRMAALNKSSMEHTIDEIIDIIAREAA